MFRRRERARAIYSPVNGWSPSHMFASAADRTQFTVQARHSEHPSTDNIRVIHIKDKNSNILHTIACALLFTYFWFFLSLTCERLKNKLTAKPIALSKIFQIHHIFTWKNLIILCRVIMSNTNYITDWFFFTYFWHLVGAFCSEYETRKLPKWRI